MAWTRIQDSYAAALIGTTLGATPTAGNVLVCFGLFRDSTINTPIISCSCQDENSSAYTQVSNSPSTQIDRGQVMAFYRIATGGEGKTATISVNSAIAGNIFANWTAEFAPPSAGPLFDNSAKGNGTAAAGTFAINAGQGAPSIPCSGADCLFVNVMDGNPATPGAVNPWVRFPADPGGANGGAAYILTAGSAQEVLWTGVGVNQFTVVGMSFKVPAVGPVNVLWAASVM